MSTSYTLENPPRSEEVDNTLTALQLLASTSSPEIFKQAMLKLCMQKSWVLCEPYALQQIETEMNRLRNQIEQFKMNNQYIPTVPSVRVV